MQSTSLICLQATDCKSRCLKDPMTQALNQKHRLCHKDPTCAALRTAISKPDIKCKWKGSGFNSLHPLHNAQCLHRRSFDPFLPLHGRLVELWDPTVKCSCARHDGANLPDFQTYSIALPFTIWWQHRCDHLPQNLLQALDNAKTNLQVSGCSACWFEKSSELQVGLWQRRFHQWLQPKQSTQVCSFQIGWLGISPAFTPNSSFSCISPHMIAWGSCFFSLASRTSFLLSSLPSTIPNKLASIIPTSMKFMYTYVCMYVCIYIYTGYTYIDACVYIYIYIHNCIYIYTRTNMHVCILI